MLEILNGLKESSEKSLKTKLAIKALDFFTSQPSIFQKEFTVISKTIFDAVYFEKSQLPKEVRE